MWFDVPFEYCVALSPAPPLTVDNIMKAVEGVKDWGLVAGFLGVLSSSSFKDAVERFLEGLGDFQPSWKAIIYALDRMGEIAFANCIRSYGEPVQGVCVCVCVYL